MERRRQAAAEEAERIRRKEADPLWRARPAKSVGAKLAQEELQKRLTEVMWKKFGRAHLEWTDDGKKDLADGIQEEVEEIIGSIEATAEGGYADEPELPALVAAALGAELTRSFQRFMVDVGLTVPVLRQISAVANLVASTYKAGATWWEKSQVEAIRDRAHGGSAIRRMGAAGIQMVLAQRLRGHKANIGRYTFDTVTSFVDVTALTGAMSAGASLIARVHHLYGTWQMTAAANAMLAKRDNFDLIVFSDCPFLCAYIFDGKRFETGTLMGLGNNFSLDALTGVQVHEDFAKLDREEREARARDVLDLEKSAKKIIADSPFVLTYQVDEL